MPHESEIEVTLIGPGYGESVVVHLGDGEWLIVDSCIDTMDPQKAVVPLRYLQLLGVKVEQAVKYIVASHWDDDHAKGLGDLVEACPQARFICSNIFPDEKFVKFVEAHSIGSAATEGGAVKNIRKVIHCLSARGQSLIRAVPGKKLCSKPVIQSWSPSSHDDSDFLSYVTQFHPGAGEPLRKAVPASGNLTSVVLSIDWSSTSVLLGADMENHPNANRGWAAIVSEINHLGGWRQADILKVPHHGSQTGHHDDMWNKLLQPNPVSLLAPFGKGPLATRPPTSSDIRRIGQKSRSLFLTARHPTTSSSKRDVAITRSLREGAISVTSRKVEVGMVRLRQKAGCPMTHELFGAACRIK